jgi:hypothetical protein
MRRRIGFTLVELLVSVALIIFVLLILSEAFRAGVASTQTLKAMGDLDQKLRTVSTLIRNDLEADHFEGKKRLSDLELWRDGPPREGFVRIWQGTRVNPPVALLNPTLPRYVPEGSDADGIPSAWATNHLLHFTVKLRGNRREQRFATPVPAGSPLLAAGMPEGRFQDTGGILTSEWAEVAYFLRRNGSTAGSTPLYSLYRRVRLLVPDNHAINWVNPVRVNNPTELQQALAAYAGVSVRKALADPNAFPDTLYFNGPMDITIPERRFGMLPNRTGGLPSVPAMYPGDADVLLTSASGAERTDTWTYPTLAEEFPSYTSLHGNDLLLSDVLSFQVEVQSNISPNDYGDIPNSINSLSTAAPTLSSSALLGAPVVAPVSRVRNPLFADTATQLKPRVFDTWSSARDAVEPNRYDYSRWQQVGADHSIPHGLQRGIYLLTPASTTGGPSVSVVAIEPITVVDPSMSQIYSVRITLRVWDAKTEQTRQITIIQDL